MFTGAVVGIYFYKDEISGGLVTLWTYPTDTWVISATVFTEVHGSAVMS